MINAREGWAIRNPCGHLWGSIGSTRSAAIMEFLTYAEADVYDEAEERAKQGYVFPLTKTTPLAQKRWPVWRRKGWMAVRVLMQTVDHRVR